MNVLMAFCYLGSWKYTSRRVPVAPVRGDGTYMVSQVERKTYATNANRMHGPNYFSITGWADRLRGGR